MTSIKELSTDELIHELASRENVQDFTTGLYARHEVAIKPKYSQDRELIRLPDNAIVLVIAQ